jgi:hypothetical protein
MVVIRLARMPAIFIQLAGEESIGTSIILDWIEYRYAIRSNRNRSAEEVVFR